MKNISGNANWIVSEEAPKKTKQKLKKNKQDDKTITEQIVKDFKLKIEKNISSAIKDTEIFYTDFKDKHISDLLVHLKSAVSSSEKIEFHN